MPRIDASSLDRRLRAGEIVRLSKAQWGRFAVRFEVVERHDTRLAGDLLLVRRDRLWAAIERPAPGQRVMRPLNDRRSARAFVAERLALYDRVWDGCGCKIDYFS